MIPACLPPRDVSRPKVPPPPDACDTHAHVFGPEERFPYAEDRSYTPPDAPLEKYLGMLDASALRAACWSRAAHTAATIPRCSMRFRAGPTGCAALRWRMPTSRRRPCANGIASASAACASIIFFVTVSCTIAAACR